MGIPQLQNRMMVSLFYDSLATGTENEGNMDALLRMLNSLGKRVTIYSWEENPDLSQTSEIIVTSK